MVTGNPLASGPAPMTMDLEFGEPAESRSPMEQLIAASCMSEEQILELGDEDLLVLMMDHMLSIGAKNEILKAINQERNDDAPEPGERGREMAGHPAEGRAEMLADRMERHQQAQEWLRRPKDAALRWLAFAFMAILMTTLYQDGSRHFREATARTDLHLFNWAREHGNARTLKFHGPTEWNHPIISKTWFNLPPHQGLHLDFRLWAVGQCGLCEGDPPEAVIQIGNSEYRTNGAGKTLKRRTNYYVGAHGGDALDAEKEASAFQWEFSVHATELPEPGPASHSAAFAEVSLQQAHTADSVTLVIRQDWHDGKDYVEMVHGVGTQQLLLDDVQLSVSTCGPPPQSAPLAPVTRRSAADRAADRATAAEALAATTANVTFLPGQGIGSTDEFIGEADSPMDCASLVAAQRPSANGVSYSAPDTGMHGCWAEFGMVGRSIDSGSLKFVSAFFGTLGGGSLLPPKWAASGAHQAHMCVPTVSECDQRQQAAEARPSSMTECQAAAEAAGLSTGGGGLEFVGEYPSGGCYTYTTGEHLGMAFWSTGTGQLTGDQQPLFTAGGSGERCKTCSQLNWPATPTGSEFVCAESDEGFACHNEIMFSEAETACLALGARLCTAAELVNLEGSHTGCGHDARFVWSSSTSEPSTGKTCSETERVVVMGRFDGDMDHIDCVDMASTTSLPALRCCADTTCSDPCDPSQEVEGTQAWRLLFRQTAGNFRSPTDWIRYNSHDTTEDFSVLNELEDCRQNDGTLHMKLVWPGLAPPATQEWKQFTNPVTSVSGGVVMGYSEVSVHYPGTEGTTDDWHGLRYSASGGDALLQADLQGDDNAAIPWFAVGTSHAYKLDNSVRSSSSLPGPRTPEGHDIASEGILVETVELFAVCPSPVVNEQQHKPRCCSDSPLRNFMRADNASANCPLHQMSYDAHECEPMPWTAAHRVCAAQGARLCTLEEIALGCTADSNCAGDGELVWTADDCEDPGAEFVCTQANCQQVNVPCDTVDLDDAENMQKILVADETAAFATHGWYNHQPDESGSFEMCDGSGCRTCSDEKCSSPHENLSGIRVEGGDCFTTGIEPKTCLDGFLPVDINEAAGHTYTCCEEDTQAFEFGTGQGSTDRDADPCTTHAQCASGHYCDNTMHCWECDSLNVDWCDSFDGQGKCCTVEILAHCPLAEWPDLNELCGTGSNSLYAQQSEMGLEYLYDSEDWREENLTTPLILQVFGYHLWLYVWIIVSSWGMSYVILCRKAPEGACNPLPVYPYVGHHIGTGDHFRVTGGYDGSLETTPSRVVLRGNAAPCSCLPGRCGGFWLQEQHRMLPAALQNRGVSPEMWEDHMHRLERIQKQYGRICDFGSRLSAGGACCLHVPWYITGSATGLCPMSWASNCYCCCNCCWRCCCCCECWTCCCCTCAGCCPGAAGFLGICWHIFVCVKAIARPVSAHSTLILAPLLRHLRCAD